ncbi:peptidoglycan recognition protein family protein [Actinomadura luteofluorescens]
MAAHAHLPPPPRRVAGPAPQSGGDRAEQGSRPHRGAPHSVGERHGPLPGARPRALPGDPGLPHGHQRLGRHRPTGALWEKLVATCAWLCDVYGLEPHAAIVGHRDYNATACPGDALYALLPRLRNQVAESLGERRPAEAPAARSGGLPGPRFTFDHGPAVGPGDPTR